MEMGGWCGLVLMAVKAMNGRVVGVHDNHGHGGSGRGAWIDVAGSVMASGTKAMVGQEDIVPTEHRVAVRAGLRVCLAEINACEELDGMVNRAAKGAVIMAREVAAVTAYTLPAARNCRGL